MTKHKQIGKKVTCQLSQSCGQPQLLVVDKHHKVAELAHLAGKRVCVAHGRLVRDAGVRTFTPEQIEAFRARAREKRQAAARKKLTALVEPVSAETGSSALQKLGELLEKLLVEEAEMVEVGTSVSPT